MKQPVTVVITLLVLLLALAGSIDSRAPERYGISGTAELCANLMKLEVVCYAGRKADERPTRFRLDGKVWSKTFSTSGTALIKPYTKFGQTMGTLYILSKQTSMPDGLWDIVSFR